MQNSCHFINATNLIAEASGKNNQTKQGPARISRERLNAALW